MSGTSTPAERLIAAAREAQAEVRQTTSYIGNDLAVAKVQALALADAVVTLAEAWQATRHSVYALSEYGPTAQSRSNAKAALAAMDAAFEQAATEMEATR